MRVGDLGLAAGDLRHCRSTAAQTALDFLSLELTKKPCLARLAERGPNGFRNMITIMIAPPVAKSLAAEGYSKQKIREYLFEHARVSYKELEFVLKYGHSEAFTIPEAVKRGIFPRNIWGQKTRCCACCRVPT